MRTVFRVMAVAAGLLVAQVAMAQAVPAGSTGVCKDGTYTNAASKKGACRGHQGVKEWLATDTAAPAAAPAKAATAAPAAAPAAAAAKPDKTATSAAASMPQAGGGPGMVWVNTATNVYHCAGTRYYGKTKAGAYMSEADAKAKGARADRGTPCTK
jgi:hypothetical protein